MFRYREDLGFLYLVQNSDCQVEISGEGDPKKIGNQKIRGGFGYLGKLYDGCQNQHPKNQQPYKGKAVQLKIEEPYGPKEVEHQL